MIESSCPWTLNLYHDNQVDVAEPWIDFMLTTNRKFSTIKLDGLLEIGHNKTIEIFQKHGFNVVKLCLIHSCLDSFSLFAEMLKCMPNLKHVIIFETSTLCDVRDVPPDLPELRKLKTVEMVASEYSIIKCFQLAKLTTIKILNSTYEHSMDSQPFEDFLRSQEMLKTLVLRSINHETSQMFRTETLGSTMPFQLTQLSLLNIRLRESPNDYNNLLKFLKPQARTLKEVELGRHFPNFVYEFVFAQMRNLKTLRLLMYGMPQDKELYERLEENRSVNNLVFIDSTPPINYNGNLSFLHDFLKRLPNIKNVTLLEYCDKELLQAIANTSDKLQTLSLCNVNEYNFDCVQCPNLTSLYIQRLEGKIDWDKFTKGSPNLTELIIEQVFDEEFLNLDDVETITKNTKLQTLRLGECFSANKRFLEIIRRNCPDLKALDLHKSCGIEDDDLLDWKTVRLWCDDDVIKCPRPLEFWNYDDYDGRFPNDDNEWDLSDEQLDPFDMHLLDMDFYDYPDDISNYSDAFYDEDEDEYDVDEDSDYGRRCAD